MSSIEDIELQLLIMNHMNYLKEMYIIGGITANEYIEYMTTVEKILDSRLDGMKKGGIFNK